MSAKKAIIVGLDEPGSHGRYCQTALKCRGYESVLFDYKPKYSRYLPYKALRRLFSAVANTETPYINKKLLEFAKHFRPDLVLVLKGENIRYSTLSALRDSTRCCIVNWFPDSILHFHLSGTLLHAVKGYDYFFAKDSYILQEMGKISPDKLFLLEGGFDATIYRPDIDITQEEEKRFGCDVTVIGSNYPYRYEVVEHLLDFDLKLWGPGWGKAPNPRIKEKWFGTCYEMENAIAIRCSKININTNHFTEVEGLNQRLFDVAGCKGFQLIDYRSSVKRLFPGVVEDVTYKNVNEMKEKVRYFLKHDLERAQIADYMFQQVYPKYTLDARLGEILATIHI